ncbi:MAG TPA: hypothetical protein VMT49_04420 [Steroidobacteraceae bacterium]|nr:hypothetical protein [Steroidobacteraceae bacterium]
MPELKLPPRTASVSDLLDAATVLFRRTLAKALPIELFAALSLGLPHMYWMTTGKPFDLLHPPLDPRFWALAAVGLVCYQFLSGLVMLRQRAMQGGAAPDLNREAAGALRRWPMLVATYVLGMVAIYAGCLLLVVPGLYLFVCLLLLRPVVLFETAGPVQALVRCVRLARPLWVKFMAAAVIATLIVIVCMVAAGACLGVVHAVVTAAGVEAAAFNAFAAACQVGVDAIALVYFNALWLVLYSVASSSA